MYIFRSKNREVRKVWGSVQMKLLGIELELVGKIDENANMIMMNHQSIVDIILFEYLAPKDIAWISKKEIGDIPWFGRVLKAPKMIMVERQNKKSLIKLIKDSKNRLDNNRPLAIFPEGTRSNGKKLLKFKAGAKVIANKFKLKVQSFVILGSLEVLDSKKLIQAPGKIKIICLPTIQASKDTSWYEDTEEQMRETLKKELKVWKS
jgi:1-acyl-sn-glycerol-3-phosphate acyltransferase